MRILACGLLLFFLVGLAGAGEKLVGFCPLVNDVSLYKNAFDSGASAGNTLQIVSINQVKLKWWFQVEFTADFNRHLTPGYATDYYLEAGVLKYVVGKVAVNYQRVHGTFVGKPVNQVGIRYSF
ncbi:MAG: hypothetical protein QHJ34_02570 [bacterium]|jgi:hypothetical protein|nr:hypothetical protein [candidate division KSB1 bacterium]MDH7559102.1 hypothetical protein [bacterium]